ncbi:MAG: energy transducer TonB, partial [Candidatus Acidiferrales bacterium]
PISFHVPLSFPQGQFWFGSEKLWTILPIDGTWRGPNDPASIYAYSMKIPWFRIHPAFSSKEPLIVTGKRLDGPAPSFSEEMWGNSFPRDEDNAMIMGGISVPTYGCWEITAQYNDQELIYTAWVVRGAQEERPFAISSTAQQSAPRRIRVDAATEAKLLVYRTIPEIPPAAEAAGISGTVVLRALISGTDGRPRDLRYASGPHVLASTAIDTVKWWRYRIELFDVDTDIETTIDVVFSPEKIRAQSPGA